MLISSSFVPTYNFEWFSFGSSGEYHYYKVFSIFYCCSGWQYPLFGKGGRWALCLLCTVSFVKTCEVLSHHIQKIEIEINFCTIHTPTNGTIARCARFFPCSIDIRIHTEHGTTFRTIPRALCLDNRQYAPYTPNTTQHIDYLLVSTR